MRETLFTIVLSASVGTAGTLLALFLREWREQRRRKRLWESLRTFEDDYEFTAALFADLDKEFAVDDKEAGRG